jgi:hypothetical protein
MKKLTIDEPSVILTAFKDSNITSYITCLIFTFSIQTKNIIVIIIIEKPEEPKRVYHK